MDQCLCDVTFYNVASLGEVPDCQPCTAGTACTEPGARLETLPLAPGYYRVTAASKDLRKCPGVHSGCRGGNSTEAQCDEGLTGVFCATCANQSGWYYDASGSPAVCKECYSAGRTAIVLFSIIATVLAIRFAWQLILHRVPLLSRAWNEGCATMRRMAVPSKLKQIGRLPHEHTPEVPLLTLALCTAHSWLLPAGGCGHHRVSGQAS